MCKILLTSIQAFGRYLGHILTHKRILFVLVIPKSKDIASLRSIIQLYVIPPYRLSVYGGEQNQREKTRQRFS